MEKRNIGLDDLQKEINRNIWDITKYGKFLGFTTITRQDLEKLKVSNTKAKINMVGILTFSDDVTPELVRETIESIKVRGTIKAPSKVQEVLNTLNNAK